MKNTLLTLALALTLTACGDTETTTIEKTPQGCHDAIAAAELFIDEMVKLTMISSQWPEVVSDALEADDAAEIDAITLRIHELNAALETLDAGDLVVEFNLGKISCSAG